MDTRENPTFHEGIVSWRETSSDRSFPQIDEPSDPPFDVMSRDDALGVGIGDDILCVDDNPSNLVAVEAALAPLSRKLVKAHSGIEALSRLLEQDFALILLDVAMPGMSGIETARMIRTRERNRGTPIIFVTAMSWHDKAIDEAYAAGGFDFLIKPIRAEVLRAKARVYLQLQERTRALQKNAEQLRESQARLHEHELLDQRKRFESELLETKAQQLAEVDRSRHEFVAILSHELRNPIHTLQVAFDLLRDHPNAKKTDVVYSLIDRRMAHVTRLVGDLLDIARVAAGQFAILREPVNVFEVAQHAIEDCRPTIEARHHVVSIDAVEGEAPMALGDHVRLLQVVTNLIDNAAKYTPAGGRIDLTVRVEAGDVVVRVTDSGRGISIDLLPRIFEMFVRERSDSAGSGGLGIGLGLVKRLVELHEGTVSATSDGPNTGSTFEVRIPLAPQDLDLPMLEAINRPRRPTVRIHVLDADPKSATGGSDDDDET